jgi:hypothetical protein
VVRYIGGQELFREREDVMKCLGLLFISLLVVSICPAQQKQDEKKSDESQGTGGMQNMNGMDMNQMPGMPMDKSGSMNMARGNLIEEILQHDTSGTSAEPNSIPIPMLMKKRGDWSLMFHGNFFVLDEQQSGPRGADKFFSTNWLMGMAQHPLGSGRFTIRNMLSLEPATISGRQYPLLFQQGETAYGKPIADGQHPHDFIMELAVLYDIRAAKNMLLSFYFAPVGDPAIGPLAYPHRASASENPVAPLGHHQEDSTHIADDVVTAGIAYRLARIEASGFHGREPNEFRWDIDQGKIDSWSLRLTLQPGKNWSGQYSYARIASPEALFPNEDQERITASVMYNRPLHDGSWVNTLVWGRTRSLQDNTIFNSYLLESTLKFELRNAAWMRIENADRSNELLLEENPLPAGFVETRVGRVQAYTFGFDRDFDVMPRLSAAVGAQFTTYGVPPVLAPFYGAHPFGVVLFVRLRPYSGEAR